jgi:hypothetical protein
LHPPARYVIVHFHGRIKSITKLNTSVVLVQQADELAKHTDTYSHTHTHISMICSVEWIHIAWCRARKFFRFSNARKNVCFFLPFSRHFRTEPQCITCDGEVLWTSRYYYHNCSHFGAYVAPQSSISTNAGVDYYILECRGPGLPLAGELKMLHGKSAKRIFLSLRSQLKTFQLENSLNVFLSFRLKRVTTFFSGRHLRMYLCK